MLVRCRYALGWLLPLLLAVAAGCEQMEPLRQGIGSNYHKELNLLAKDLGSKERDRSSETAAAAKDADEVQPVNHWHAAPLIDAVKLRPPVPLD